MFFLVFPVNSESIKKIGTSLNTLANEKQKLEKVSVLCDAIAVFLQIDKLIIISGKVMKFEVNF